jgi:hypothetical protein
MSALISTPHLAFYFADETVGALTERWNDWVGRGATVVTRKEQAEDSPGVLFELLRTTIRLTPALAAEVAIAEPRLHREQSDGAILMFYPCLPWPTFFACRFKDGDPDVIWVLPRELTADGDSPCAVAHPLKWLKSDS